MNFKEWENITEYKIDDKFKLIKAKPEEFSTYNEIYFQGRYSTFETAKWTPSFSTKFFKDSQRDYKGFSSKIFWILKNEIRIGGAMILPNCLERFFMIPPYSNLEELAILFKLVLLKISEPNNPISVYQIFEDQINTFITLGFEIEAVKRNMLAATQSYEIKWDDKFKIRSLFDEDIDKLIEFQHRCFIGHIPHPWMEQEDTEEEEIAELKEDLVDTLELHKKNEVLKNASLLVYTKSENRLIGMITVKLKGDIPEIEDVAVDKEFRSQGIGSMIIKHAISVLHKVYPAVGLSVFKGNSAESLYQKLGFVAGQTKNYLQIPKEKSSEE